MAICPMEGVIGLPISSLHKESIDEPPPSVRPRAAEDHRLSAIRDCI
jgi:hypothetical protein